MGNAAGLAQAGGRIDYFSGTPRADAIDRWIYVAMAGGEVIPHLTYVITRESFASGPLAA
jgi:hypothetical protein